MLRLWLSTDRKANTKRILEEICKNDIEGQILLVPEQFSHMAEHQLCEYGGPKVNRFAEVLSFSRLATRVFSEVGGNAQTQTDAAGKLMIMSLAVEQVQSRLKLYATSVDKPQFLLKLIDTLEELRCYCVDVEQLRRAASELGGALAVKAEEFALLMESYDAVCANMGQNPQTRLARLVDALDGSDFADGKRFYIDAFSDFNGVELEVIASLLAGGAEITVCLHSDALDSQLQQFASVRQAAKDLQRIAQKQAVEVLTQTFDDDAQTPLTYLSQRIFSGRLEPYAELTDAISFIEGADIVSECRIAAGRILKLVQNGARFRDITIACGDYENYRTVLESVFRRAKIPAYFAGDTDILNQSVVQMLLSALQAATGTMETQTVLQYLKSGFLTIRQDRCDRMENYILMWNIQGSQWQQEWTKNPFGLAAKTNERSNRLLQELNEDRISYILPLVRLRDELKKSKDTAQMLLAFTSFMERIQLRQQLHQMSQQLFEQKQLQKAQQYVQIYSLVCRLLEQMYGVLGQSVRSPESFYQTFCTALSQCSVGTIPAALDSVNVGSVLSQRRGDSPYLFLLGANEGAFPAAQGNNTLLSDQERLKLLDVGVPIGVRATASLNRELAAIAGVLQVPSKGLYFGASGSSEAYLIKRAKELYPNVPRYYDDTALIERSERDYLNYLLRNPKLITNEDKPLVRQLQEKYNMGKLSEQSVQQLYGTDLQLSSTKIDNLASCRFAYFLQFGLKAEERKEAKIDALTFGTFIHDVLEHCCRQVHEEGGFHKVSLERTLQIARERMHWYAQQELGDLWESERAEYLFRRRFAEIEQSVIRLWNEMSQSLFEPQWFELRFGDDGELPSVKIVGEKMTAYLQGAVDRADIWRHNDRVYVRVVDYKSGKTSFSMEKVINGIGLQMLLYLFTLRSNGVKLIGQEMTPAGVIYFPARVEHISAKGKYDKDIEKNRLKNERRSGMILGTEPVLRAMEPSDTPILLPDEKHYATSEQFEKLEKFVFRIIASMADSLSDGVVAPNPYQIDDYKNSCKYCPYHEVCHNTKVERWIEEIKKPEIFWQAVEGVE